MTSFQLSDAVRRTLLIAIVCLAGSAAPAWAQGPLACSASTGQAFIRVDGLAERTSDVVVTCSGGVPTPVGNAVPATTFTLTFNAGVTSRVLGSGWSEALLLIDEPAPANQTVCASGTGVCPMTGTGTGAGTYNGAVDRPNVFQGAFAGGNGLTWTGIPFDPPGNSGTRVLRFTNLRVNPNAVGPGANISVTVDGGTVTIANPLLLAGTAQASFSDVSNGQLGSTNGQLSKFSVVLSENFAGVFKQASSSGPFFADQNQPPAPLDYETGFRNSLFPTLGSHGTLSIAGKPDSGSRVRIRMFNVPTQATVTAPLIVQFASSSVAKLINADGNGVGLYAPATVGTLANSGGTVVAVYELTQTAANAYETLEIPFTLAYGAGAPQFQVLNGDVGLAPFDSTPSADATAPIPRFNAVLAFQVTAPRDPLRITTSTLPNPSLGANYAQTIQAAGGTPPYTFAFAPPSSTNQPPPGLAMLSTGVLSGIPITAGTFHFTVIARDSLNPPSNATMDYTVTIPPVTATLLSSVSRLDFTAPAGGIAPPVQTFQLAASSQGSLGFTVTIDAGVPNSTAPAWLHVSPPSGNTPAMLTVSVDPGSLPVGAYNARILVTVIGSTQSPVTIPVTLNITAAVTKLRSSVTVLHFRARSNAAGAQTGFLLLDNTGSTGPTAYSAIVVGQSSWIGSVTPGNGNVGSQVPTLIQVAVNTTGLAAGSYRDVVRFTAGSTSLDVPVVVRVAPNGPALATSQTGVKFSIVQGNVTQVTRSIKIQNIDQNTSLSWTADVPRGGNWLALTATSGTATFFAPGTLGFSVQPTASSLPAGTYYALVRITSSGASYSPRYVVAVLNVKASGQPGDIESDAAGFTLTGVAHSPNTASHAFALNANTSGAVAFQAAASTSNGSPWLSVSPLAATVSSSGSQALTITADPTNLDAGVYKGEVTVATATTSQTLNMTFIVTATCTPASLALTSTGLTNNFSLSAGWPAPLTVDVRDNCGSPVANASVVATFSNGDPSLALTADDLTGVYSGTWQPSTALDQTNVRINASSTQFPTATAVLTGAVKSNAVPTLFRDGTVNNLNPSAGGPLAPGMVSAVFGGGLATASESTGVVPLQTVYKGTDMLVGALEAPLFYVSPGQLNVQIPSELAANTSYPVVVTVNGAITVPDDIDVVPMQPGVAAFADGTIIAQHANFVLVDANNPAKRGEFLIMYLVGLGATNPSVASGAPSPSTLPLGQPLVAPTVSVDGQSTSVAFAGLTPQSVGLFQINFKVPDNARLNTPLDVVVKQGAVTANVTQLVVTQ